MDGLFLCCVCVVAAGGRQSWWICFSFKPPPTFCVVYLVLILDEMSLYAHQSRFGFISKIMLDLLK